MQSRTRLTARRRWVMRPRKLLAETGGRGCCAVRSVLAEAISLEMLRGCGEEVPVTVESASVGPALGGDHDARVLHVRRQTRFATARQADALGGRPCRPHGACMQRPGICTPSPNRWSLFLGRLEMRIFSSAAFATTRPSVLPA
jgi:hypothetical protein